MQIRSGTSGVQVSPLPRAACLELLRTARTGRVVLVGRSLPGSLPVHYTVDHDEVVFRLERATPAASMIDGSVIAFQVDAVELNDHTGWSVVVVGRAAALHEQDTALVRLATLQVMGHRLEPRQA